MVGVTSAPSAIPPRPSTSTTWYRVKKDLSFLWDFFFFNLKKSTIQTLFWQSAWGGDTLAFTGAPKSRLLKAVIQSYVYNPPPISRIRISRYNRISNQFKSHPKRQPENNTFVPKSSNTPGNKHLDRVFVTHRKQWRFQGRVSSLHTGILVPLTRWVLWIKSETLPFSDVLFGVYETAISVWIAYWTRSVLFKIPGLLCFFFFYFLFLLA